MPVDDCSVVFCWFNNSYKVNPHSAGRAMDGGSGRRAVILIGGLGHVLVCAGYLFVDHVGPLLWML
ncbi:hypothetical protein, partial [Aromatoleum sp.]|uniref:hypothetical protein n=1 Tax=Aromatoleum sp. TaxID=2307007 RepID=UPI002FC61731